MKIVAALLIAAVAAEDKKDDKKEETPKTVACGVFSGELFKEIKDKKCGDALKEDDTTKDKYTKLKDLTKEVNKAGAMKDCTNTNPYTKAMQDLVKKHTEELDKLTKGLKDKDGKDLTGDDLKAAQAAVKTETEKATKDADLKAALAQKAKTSENVDSWKKATCAATGMTVTTYKDAKCETAVDVVADKEPAVTKVGECVTAGDLTVKWTMAKAKADAGVALAAGTAALLAFAASQF